MCFRLHVSVLFALSVSLLFSSGYCSLFPLQRSLSFTFMPGLPQKTLFLGPCRIFHGCNATDTACFAQAEVSFLCSCSDHVLFPVSYGELQRYLETQLSSQATYIQWSDDAQCFYDPFTEDCLDVGDADECSAAGHLPYVDWRSQSVWSRPQLMTSSVGRGSAAEWALFGTVTETALLSPSGCHSTLLALSHHMQSFGLFDLAQRTTTLVSGLESNVQSLRYARYLAELRAVNATNTRMRERARALLATMQRQAHYLETHNALLVTIECNLSPAVDVFSYFLRALVGNRISACFSKLSARFTNSSVWLDEGCGGPRYNATFTDPLLFESANLSLSSTAQWESVKTQFVNSTSVLTDADLLHANAINTLQAATKGTAFNSSLTLPEIRLQALQYVDLHYGLFSLSYSYLFGEFFALLEELHSRCLDEKAHFTYLGLVDPPQRSCTLSEFTSKMSNFYADFEAQILQVDERLFDFSTAVVALFGEESALSSDVLDTCFRAIHTNLTTALHQAHTAHTSPLAPSSTPEGVFLPSVASCQRRYLDFLSSTTAVSINFDEVDGEGVVVSNEGQPLGLATNAQIVAVPLRDAALQISSGDVSVFTSGNIPQYSGTFPTQWLTPEGDVVYNPPDAPVSTEREAVRSLSFTLENEEKVEVEGRGVGCGIGEMQLGSVCDVCARSNYAGIDDYVCKSCGNQPLVTHEEIVEFSLYQGTPACNYSCLAENYYPYAPSSSSLPAQCIPSPPGFSSPYNSSTNLPCELPLLVQDRSVAYYPLPAHGGVLGCSGYVISSAFLPLVGDTSGAASPRLGFHPSAGFSIDFSLAVLLLPSASPVAVFGSYPSWGVTLTRINTTAAHFSLVICTAGPVEGGDCETHVFKNALLSYQDDVRLWHRISIAHNSSHTPLSLILTIDSTQTETLALSRPPCRLYLGRVDEDTPSHGLMFDGRGLAQMDSRYNALWNWLPLSHPVQLFVDDVIIQSVSEASLMDSFCPGNLVRAADGLSCECESGLEYFAPQGRCLTPCVTALVRDEEGSCICPDLSLLATRADAFSLTAPHLPPSGPLFLRGLRLLTLEGDFVGVTGCVGTTHCAALLAENLPEDQCVAVESPDSDHTPTIHLTLTTPQPPMVLHTVTVLPCSPTALSALSPSFTTPLQANFFTQSAQPLALPPALLSNTSVVFSLANLSLSSQLDPYVHCSSLSPTIAAVSSPRTSLSNVVCAEGYFLTKNHTFDETAAVDSSLVCEQYRYADSLAFTHPSGPYPTPTLFSLSCGSGQQPLFSHRLGNDSTYSEWTVYTAPLQFQGPSTVTLLAYCPSNDNESLKRSEEGQRLYELQSTLPNVVFYPPPSTEPIVLSEEAGYAVLLYFADGSRYDDAVFLYTVDGAAPSFFGPRVGSGEPIQIVPDSSFSCLLKVQAYVSGYSLGPVVSAHYRFSPSTLTVQTVAANTVLAVDWVTYLPTDLPDETAVEFYEPYTEPSQYGELTDNDRYSYTTSHKDTRWTHTAPIAWKDEEGKSAGQRVVDVLLGLLGITCALACVNVAIFVYIQRHVIAVWWSLHTGQNWKLSFCRDNLLVWLKLKRSRFA